MRRADLIALVESCADLARVPQPEKGRLVEAVSNPSVTRVARGSFEVVDAEGHLCHCPMALAGFFDFRERDLDGTKIEYEPAQNFIMMFDSKTRPDSDAGRRVRVIEVED